MFTGVKYATKGIKENVRTFLHKFIWYMIETMEVKSKDYLQVFILDNITEEGKLKQKVIHTQEEPDYRKEYVFCTKHIVSGKVYVINDVTHCTMLLAEEY